MKLPHLFFLAAFAASVAQVPAAPPDAAATLRYIHASWDSLTRSTTDCHSLVDPKVTTPPVLYLPVGLAKPEDVAAVEQQCHVRVLVLPKRIDKIGDLQPQDLSAQGLLYLPNPYIVPGGRFNEMYGWDSYFILLGLEAEHREKLAKGIVDNFLFEIEHYGGVLNANRTYYLTRSQPPFLTSMIRAVLRRPGQLSGHARRPHRRTEWLSTPMKSLKRTTPPGPAPSTRPASPTSPAIGTTAPAPCPRWPTTAATIPM